MIKLVLLPITLNKHIFAFTGGPETEEQTRLRFQVELEFVQCLANPNYLNCKLTFNNNIYK